MESTSTELTTTQKDAIHRRVQGRMRRWYGEERGSTGMGCIYWMQTGMVELHRSGINCMPAAGTAHFEMQPDDVKNVTHLTFEWGGDPNAELRRTAVLTGDNQVALPEMHCWIWLPDTKEVVDFSTGHIPTLAKTFGFEWKTKPPPPYIWARPESLFPRAIYQPSRDATKLAIQTLVAAHQKGTRQ